MLFHSWHDDVETFSYIHTTYTMRLNSGWKMWNVNTHWIPHKSQLVNKKISMSHFVFHEQQQERGKTPSGLMIVALGDVENEWMWRHYVDLLLHNRGERNLRRQDSFEWKYLYSQQQNDDNCDLWVKRSHHHLVHRISWQPSHVLRRNNRILPCEIEIRQDDMYARLEMKFVCGKFHGTHGNENSLKLMENFSFKSKINLKVIFQNKTLISISSMRRSRRRLNEGWNSKSDAAQTISSVFSTQNKFEFNYTNIWWIV